MNGSRRTPERALADLEARLRRARAPILRGLRPGLSSGEVRKELGGIGGPPSAALVALYSWRDGADGSGTEAELIPGARFPPLKEAIHSREFELRLAAENEAQPEHPAAEFFAPDWFPILADPAGNLYVVEQLGAGRVLLIDREDVADREEIADSLVAFVDGIARDGSEFKPPPLSDTVAALVAALESRDPEARVKAVRELTRKRPGSAYEPLVSMLESRDAEARRQAALLLGLVGDRRAIPILVRCIARWTGKDVTSAWGGLAAIGKEGALGHLAACLTGGDPELRLDAIKGLVVSRDARAVPALQAAASGDSDPQVRAAATQAIRALGQPR